MSHHIPSISVAIPTRDSSRSLSLLLSSLSPQLNQLDEVIVVDDCSTREEVVNIASLSSWYGCRFLCLEDTKNKIESLGRRSHARNLATRSSSRDVILYLDSDMVLPPHYLNSIRAYFSINDSIMVKGARPSISISDQTKGSAWCLKHASKPPKHSPFPEYKSGSNMGNLLAFNLLGCDLSRRTFVLLMLGLLGSLVPWSQRPTLDYSWHWDWCASNNLSVSRKAVERVGFWDENFFGWGEEDIDFAYRLFRSGVYPVMPRSDELWAYHLDHQVDIVKNGVDLKRNAGYLVKKFPKLLRCRAQAYEMHGLVVDIEAGTII